MSTPIDLDEWGPNVRRRREQLGLSQVETAARAETTQHTVSRVETNDFRPTYALQIRLANALESTVTELFPRTVEEAALAEHAVPCTEGHE